MQKVIFFGAFALFLCGVVDSEARPQRVDQIPNGSMLGCGSCHTSSGGGGPRNAFGQAIQNGFLSGSGGGASVTWNATLAGMDSDNDGFTNGTELGDPDGDGNPTAGAQVTNPGDATSFPQVANTAPAFGTLGAKSVNENVALTFVVTATDADNDTVTLTASNLPTGATFANGNFTWTPGFDQSGSYTVTFNASDGKDQTTATVQITVADVIRPLTLTSFTPNRTTLVHDSGDTVRVSVVATSPDRGNLTYAWQFNGIAQGETSASYLATASGGIADDTVLVTIGDGTESVTKSWTITKELLGDFNGNNSVDFPDFLVFVSLFGKTSADAAFNASADFNGNGTIDFPDFLSFVSFFGLTK